jgi:hypothetical protein
MTAERLALFATALLLAVIALELLAELLRK